MEPQPSNHNSSSHTAAPLYSLPRRQFQGVEYPGYVSTTSVPRAISNLGGLGALDRAFHRPAKEEAFVELKLRPDDPFSHPIPGVVAPASTLVLKIVKRRRKLKDVPMEGDPKATTEPIGEFTAEPMGTLPKTIRFRSTSFNLLLAEAIYERLFSGMADFQFRPDESDPISQLRHAMQKMDGKRSRNHSWNCFSDLELAQWTRYNNSGCHLKTQIMSCLYRRQSLNPWI